MDCDANERRKQCHHGPRQIGTHHHHFAVCEIGKPQDAESQGDADCAKGVDTAKNKARDQVEIYKFKTESAFWIYFNMIKIINPFKF